MIKWLTDVMSSKSGISSKRVITFGAFLLMAIAFMGNLIFKLTIEEFMYETMSYIVIGGLGFTASELFANRKTRNETQVTLESNVTTQEIGPNQ